LLLPLLFLLLHLQLTLPLFKGMNISSTNRFVKCSAVSAACVPSTWPAASIVRLIQTRRFGWIGHVAYVGDTRNAYRNLVGKSELKSLLGRIRCR
jgi:hypothetical protein